MKTMWESADGLKNRRRDFQSLAVLGSLEAVIGIGALLAVSIRAILVADDITLSVGITVVVLLALAFLLLAMRTRAGQELVRQELVAMEYRYALDLEEERVDSRSHPYRTSMAGHK
jgi:hypothetical protein